MLKLSYQIGRRANPNPSSDGTTAFDEVSDIPSEPFGLMVGFEGHLRDVFIHSIVNNISQTLSNVLKVC